jgi:hypothetical protein
LFADNGLFGSFSQKIWAAYFMNIIGPRRRRDLDLIRLIRNRVSHDMNPISFAMPEIASRCRELDELPSPSATPGDLRERFMGTAAHLMTALFFRGAQAPLNQLARMAAMRAASSSSTQGEALAAALRGFSADLLRSVTKPLGFHDYLDK